MIPRNDHAPQYQKEPFTDNRIAFYDVSTDFVYSLSFDRLTLARYLILCDLPEKAIDYLGYWEHDFEVKDRPSDLIELFILRTISNNLMGNIEKAKEDLLKAVGIALDEGFLQLFVNDVKDLHDCFVDIRSDYLPTKKQELSNTEKQILAFIAEIEKLTTNDVKSGSLLTNRELEILQLIAEGKSNEEISRLLKIANSTVRTHIKNTNQKLNSRNRVHMIYRAKELELLH